MGNYILFGLVLKMDTIRTCEMLVGENRWRRRYEKYRGRGRSE